MKKILLSVFITISISIIIPCKLYAIDITAGITSWYAWIGEQYNLEPDPQTVLKIDHGLLYGPALSVIFNKNVNLTFVYLYGKLYYTEKHNEYDFTSKRSDVDLALNFRLNNYFKLFAGIKYLSFDSMRVECETAFDIAINQGDHKSFGPGGGLSFTFRILEDLFLLATMSGFYLRGDETIEVTNKLTPWTIPWSFMSGYRDYGWNGTISIAYYIAESTAISLGTRHQEFKTKHKENLFYATIRQTITGITLTAIHTFNIL